MPASGKILAYQITGTMNGTAAVDFPAWLRIGFTNQPRIADLASAVLNASQNIVSVVMRLNSNDIVLPFNFGREFPRGSEPVWGELSTIYAIGWGRNGDKLEWDLRMDCEVN